MKRLVTFRIDQGLLASARHAAEAENRTLTNFVETVLKAALKYKETRTVNFDDDVRGADQTRGGEGSASR